jgi:transposase
MTIAITRTDLTGPDLRQAAARSDDSAFTRRALALALVLEGKSRAEAANSAGMDRQTLRDWVHRYNDAGLDGLKDRTNPGGAEPKLSADQQAQLAEWVRQGPDPERHAFVRWRLVDLRDEIDRAFAIKLHERSVGKILERLNFRRMSVRPRHPKQDAAAQQAHKKTSPPSSPRSFQNGRETNLSRSGGKTKPGSASKAA